MTIKYEPVFGDQSLFDNAPEDAEYAGWFCQEVRWYMILNGKILFSDGGTWCTSDNPYLSADIAAMRRVIKTPTWTRANKEAGVLPPVGAELYFEAGQCYVEFVGVDVNSSFWHVRKSNGEMWSANVNSFYPIETPEEKAQREQEEFVASFNSEKYSNPTLYREGLRDAYHKLKAPTND